MMNLKSQNKAGISFIEVMCALALLSITLISLSALQSSLLRNALKSANRVERSILIKNILYEARENNEITLEKEENGFKIKYTQQPLTDSSPLIRYKNLFIEKVTITWSGLFGESTDELITYIYKSAEKENETGL
jgi:hypothetical protein